MQIKTETRVGLFILLALGIFFYMSFHIGVFRFDRSSYKPYVISFNDVSGILRKSDVKIAGVKVGWVEDVRLLDDGVRAQVRVMVLKHYTLYHDAYAVVRQEGMLGAKYIEITPGDPSAARLQAGDELQQPGVAPVSVDELMRQFKRIATNVEEVTNSFKVVLGDVPGQENLRFMVRNLVEASDRIASFSNTLDRVLIRNEDNLNGIMGDMREFAHDIRNNIPGITDSVRRLAERLESQTLPAFQHDLDRIANVFDNEFSVVADSLKSTANTIEEAAVETREGMKNIGEVATKINEGKGLLGKLITDEQTYQDVKVAIQGVKDYVAHLDRLGIVINTWSESMYRPAENMFNLEDSKGYFHVRVFPSEDRFYILGLMGSIKGTINRTDTFTQYYNQDGCQLSQENLDYRDQFRFAPRQTVEQYVRDTWRLEAQFGKIFKDVTLRFGLFDGTVGAAIDYDIPFERDDLRWITSLQAFDLRGRNRLSDRRPHLKWLNSVFWLRNFYMVFGADDFISKRNASGFFGVGLYFHDDDLKYLLSNIFIPA